MCEYDALPEIGHACGHNLISEAGIAAGLGVKGFLESNESGITGTITVMGTPAEEGGGGKIFMIERGAFDGVDIAIMAHPNPHEIAIPFCLCIQELEVHFTGKAAHAAAFPWEGVNALDAAVLAYTNVSVLRQQMKPNWRVHAVFTNGGVKPNIIPEKASLLYYVRAPTREELDVLKEKVIACFHAAAQATGCSVEIKNVGKIYENIKSNQVLADIYVHHMNSLGISGIQNETEGTGSTDMGNVSHVVPTIHPLFLVGSGKEVNHTREFTAIANTPEAHAKTLLVGKALCFTCIDVLTGGDTLMKEIKDAFDNRNY